MTPRQLRDLDGDSGRSPSAPACEPLPEIRKPGPGEYHFAADCPLRKYGMPVKVDRRMCKFCLR